MECLIDWQGASLTRKAMVVKIMKKMCLVLGCFILVNCSKKIENTAAYQAACYGATISKQALTQAINQGQEDGYAINRQFNCIDKTSYLAMKEDETRWLAANTPEAKAKEAAEFAKKKLIDDANRAKVVAEQQATAQVPQTRRIQWYRCTSPDGKASYITRGNCNTGDTQRFETAQAPLLERSDKNDSLIRCTSKDGEHESIQRGNCNNPDDYQQLL